MGDWLITAGILAISLVLILISLSLDTRVKKLEIEIKKMNETKKVIEKGPLADKLYADLEEEIVKYNQSYGDPTYTEWIDKDYDSKGVK